MAILAEIELFIMASDGNFGIDVIACYWRLVNSDW
jgi:hypothetical protein